ncbi:MAG: nickel pincer cofactor biosynthesis protein LarC [Chloroflexi bacterium]|nr:nickel pincer cofactor biosynthesis protein LarC [Chloroflexota bacterium]
MRIAYFDCYSGISGDMILASLIDAGLNIEDLKAELSKLNLSGYKLSSEKVSKNGISGTKLHVDISEDRKLRKLKDVVDIMESSGLDEDIREKALSMFRELAEIEAEIHSRPVGEVHFHELSGLDTIIDITGALAGIKLMGIEKVFSSKVHVGRGFVTAAHGILPTPAPATARLLTGIPIYSRGIDGELVTPTGAVIIKNIALGFGDIPDMIIGKIGYGAGDKDYDMPNHLRLFLGETVENQFEEDSVVQIEANIDDMNPEYSGYVMDKLFEKGALDVFFTPVIMKKNRPAIKISVICDPGTAAVLTRLIFRETTTLGVRTTLMRRKKMKTDFVIVNTEVGEIRVKLGLIKDEVVNVSPEYGDCRRAAEKYNLPLKKVYEIAGTEAAKVVNIEQACCGGQEACCDRS